MSRKRWRISCFVHRLKVDNLCINSVQIPTDEHMRIKQIFKLAKKVDFSRHNWVSGSHWRTRVDRIIIYARLTIKICKSVAFAKQKPDISIEINVKYYSYLFFNHSVLSLSLARSLIRQFVRSFAHGSHNNDF